MKKITLEKVLWFIGRLIRAVFLIAWNLGRVGLVLFVMFLGAAGEHARAVEEEARSDNSEDVEGACLGIRERIRDRDWEWE